MLMVQSSMLGVGPTLLLAPGERAHAAGSEGRRSNLSVRLWVPQLGSACKSVSFA
jgi:hypothetical protein